MSCSAQDLENALVTLDGFYKLSERDILICKAYVYGLAAGFTTAQDALNAAAASGMAKVSERDLESEFLAVIS